MKFKKFDKVEEELSVIGLGTWQFGGPDAWPNFSKEESLYIFDMAIDAGINFIDTAPVYGLGGSEEFLKDALKGKRDKVLVATKNGLPWDADKNVTTNLSKKSIIKEMDDSLLRMGLDYVDIVQPHWPDGNIAIGETLEALEYLKQEGKIRYFGVCNHRLDDVKGLKGAVSFQGLYNMLEPNASHYHNIELGYKAMDEIIPYAEKNGMFYLPYSPLMQGLLAGKKEFSKGAVAANPMLQGEKLASYLKCASIISKELGKPIQEIALNWLIHQKAVGPIIAGATKREHLTLNLKALSWEMDESTFSWINKKVKEEILL